VEDGNAAVSGGPPARLAAGVDDDMRG
jgi:hypothetical protein